MRSVLAALSLWPAVVAAQEAAQQATPAEQWRVQQVALGTKGAAERPKKAQDLEKRLVDLERRETAVFTLLADDFRDSDPQSIPARFIRELGQKRRPRVELEQLSAVRLDSMRRYGDVTQIKGALEVRRLSASSYARDADTDIRVLKEDLVQSRRSLDRARADDNPANTASLKAAIKKTIDLYEKIVRLEQGIIDFESNRSEALKKEVAEIEKQLSSAPSQ